MNPFTTYLQTFYALTVDGLWRVSTERYQISQPIVERIANLPGKNLPLGERLRMGAFVAVTSKWIGLYLQKDGYQHKDPVFLQTPEETDETDIGTKTKEVIALFLAEKHARKFAQKDLRKVAQNLLFTHTVATLKKIGENHPIFVVARSGEIGFSCEITNELEAAGWKLYKKPTISKALLIQSLPPDPRERPLTLGKRESEEIRPPSAPKDPPQVRAPKVEKEKTAKVIKKKEAKPEPEKIKPLVVVPESSTTLFGSFSPQPIEMNEQVFFEFPRIRNVREVIDVTIVKATMPAGKHKMILVTSPMGDENDPWYIAAELYPQRIVGNSQSFWKQWFQSETPEDKVTRTTVKL